MVNFYFGEIAVMKNILLLGATGSIGDSVLDVISQNQDKLNLIGISIN